MALDLFKSVKPETLINDRLFHFKFPNQYVLTATLMRMQEFYESPYENIRGKYFTVEEYMDSYADINENFTYNTDWNGFNIPGNAIVKFYKLFKEQNDLLKKEEQFISLLMKTLTNHGIDKEGFEAGNFYVIATHDERDVNHEIAHGLFYLNEDFKKEMMDLNHKNKELEYWFEAIMEMGYCDDVLYDEVQAYLSTSSMVYLDEHFSGIDIDWKSVLEYQKVFDRFTQDDD